MHPSEALLGFVFLLFFVLIVNEQWANFNVATALKKIKSLEYSLITHYVFF